jgi:hypothetical protein
MASSLPTTTAETEQTGDAASIDMLTILRDHCVHATKNKKEASAMFANLYGIIKEKQATPIKVQNVIFLMFIRGKGIVEIHVLGDEKSIDALANDLHMLHKYMQQIGVVAFYIPTNDKKIAKAIVASQLRPEKIPADIGHGETLTTYLFQV